MPNTAALMFVKARRSNTLVVSEVKENQIYIMINFLYNADNSISFEFNRPNILLEGLTISNEILLLGGAELDVAILYREIEEDLSLLVMQLRSTEAKSVLADEALARREEQLEQEQAKLIVARGPAVVRDNGMVPGRRTNPSYRSVAHSHFNEQDSID